jgi:hypothetical protein
VWEVKLLGKPVANRRVEAILKRRDLVYIGLVLAIGFV